MTVRSALPEERLHITYIHIGFRIRFQRTHESSEGHLYNICKESEGESETLLRVTEASRGYGGSLGKFDLLLSLIY